MKYSENVLKYKPVEEKFAGAFEMFNSISFSTEEQDIKEHWDVKIEMKVDVKAMRKYKRTDEHPNENLHYVEIKNVNGEHGWLYGKADYFSFETEEYFVIVPKKRLQQFIATKCANKEYSKQPEFYKLYSRQGRKDIITLVKTIDLMYISDKVIQKNINDQKKDFKR